MNPIIKALQDALSKERDDEMTAFELCTGPVGYCNGHEASTARLLGLLEKSFAVIEFYGDRNNWKCWDTYTDVKDVITASDLGCKSYSEKADYAIPSGGRRAREFLLSLSETNAAATTLADASGEDKHEP